MPGRLNGKVAVVTGGANGIGRAVSELYAEEGAWVLVADLEEKAGENTVDNIRQKGGRAEFQRTDASSAKDAAAAIQFAVNREGAIDILCNNAAFLTEFHDALESTHDEWSRSFDVTVMGTHFMTREALPHMLRRRSGSIVNVVSIQGMVACGTSTAYSTMKAGLLGYTRSIAFDYGPHNIRANALCPGPIQTRIAPAEGTPWYVSQCERTLLGRVGSAREVAWAALFLATDESSFVTGAILPVDGGWTAK